MFVSRTLDYALRSLIYLASHPSQNTANLREISASAAVPKSYLAKLMRGLVKAEIVRSDAGAHGGYRLARQPAAISLKDIYEAVEGHFRTVVCGDGTDACELHHDCTQVAVWDIVELEILNVLQRRSLSDFMSPSSLTSTKLFPIEHIHA